MDVSISTPLPDTDQPHRLFLLPQSDRDRSVLERLLASYRLTNFGRDAVTGLLTHVGLELTRSDHVTVTLEPSDEGGYTATIAGRPGCISEGETIPEALRNLAEAVELYDEQES